MWELIVDSGFLIYCGIPALGHIESEFSQWQ